MYSINDRWNNRNRAKRNESPNFVTATVPIQGMRDNNGNAITSNTVEENVSVPSQSIAPSEVQPAIPTTDTDMPDPSEYHQFQDLYSQLYENPITPEEEEKRKRAASAVEGIGHLGNVMNAFSNLIFTGKGAPSQQLPEVPDEIQKFEDRMAEKRRMYASGLMGAKARDLQDWKDAYTMSYNQKKAIDDRAMELMKLNANMTSQQAKLQAQQDIAAKRAEETKRHNQAMESIGWTNAQTARSNKNSSSRGASGNAKEVAYITKYGDVIFDNPKNKRTVTLSLLEVMRNKASDDEKRSIDGILRKIREGDINSYNDAEMYVSQNLNNDAVALKHLFEQAKKYGRVVGDEGQKELRDKARNYNLPPYKKDNNASKAPYLR